MYLLKKTFESKLSSDDVKLNLAALMKKEKKEHGVVTKLIYEDIHAQILSVKCNKTVFLKIVLFLKKKEKGTEIGICIFGENTEMYKKTIEILLMKLKTIRKDPEMKKGRPVGSKNHV